MRTHAQSFAQINLGMEGDSLPSQLIESLAADDVADEDDHRSKEAFALVHVAHRRRRPQRPVHADRDGNGPGQRRAVLAGEGVGPASVEGGRRESCHEAG